MAIISVSRLRSNITLYDTLKKRSMSTKEESR